jgi:hypothetical protein
MPDWDETVTVKANGQEHQVKLSELRDLYASAEGIKSQAKVVQFARSVINGMQSDPKGTLEALGEQYNYAISLDDSDTDIDTPGAPPASSTSPAAGAADMQKMIADAVTAALRPIQDSVSGFQNEFYGDRARSMTERSVAAFQASDPRTKDQSNLEAIYKVATENKLPSLDLAYKVWLADNPVPAQAPPPPLPFMGAARANPGVKKEPVEATFDNLDAVMREAMSELYESGKLGVSSNGQIITNEDQAP